MAPPLGATLQVASPEVLLAFRRSEYFHHAVLEVDAAAADVWAAGICLYIMLTGEAPFFGGNQQLDIERHRFRDAIKAQYSWVSCLSIFPHSALHASHCSRT